MKEASDYNFALWEEALQHLRQNELVAFLRTLKKLKQGIFQELNGKTFPEDLDAAYAAICKRAGMNEENITQFMSQEQYQLCCSVAVFTINESFSGLSELVRGKDVPSEHIDFIINATTTRQSIQYLLPMNSTLRDETLELSPQQETLVRDFITHEVDFVRDASLTEEQVQMILTDLTELADRLDNQPRLMLLFSFHGLLDRKKEILNKLTDRLRSVYESSKDTLTAGEVNDLIEAEEKGELSTHRHWPQYYYYALFFKKPPPTASVQGLQKIRARITSEAEEATKKELSEGPSPSSSQRSEASSSHTDKTSSTTSTYASTPPPRKKGRKEGSPDGFLDKKKHPKNAPKEPSEEVTSSQDCNRPSI